MKNWNRERGACISHRTTVIIWRSTCILVATDIGLVLAYVAVILFVGRKMQYIFGPPPSSFSR